LARRDRGILNELVKFPWWVSAGLAGLAYIFLIIFAGALPDRPLFNPLAPLMKKLAPFVAFVLLVVAVVSAYFQFRKGRLLERQTGLGSVGELSWRQFESLVSEAFRRDGFLVLDNIEDGPDGGVDLTLSKNGQVVFLQCKHWKARSVGVKVVRELSGVMAARGVKHGIVVTYGDFTSEAREFAKSNSITLIDGPRLPRLIASVQESGSMKVPQETVKKCPKCGNEMVLRVAKKGPKVGEKFWGCSKFPNCSGMLSFER
jgi:restriction system protein